MKTLALLFLALATPAFAQVTPATPGGFTTQGTGTAAGISATVTAKPKALGAGDKKFLKDSLEGMFFVMELVGKAKTGAKIEVTKTESGALKGDLDKVWAEVAGYASNNNEKIPAELTGGDKGKAFVEAYKKRYNGKLPDAMAALGYDSAVILTDAIKRAGSTEGPKVQAALAETKDFDAVTGKITINKQRDADKAAVILKVKDGKFSYVETVAP